MSRAAWLAVLAVSGAAFFGLSFVNAWIVHDRELLGEGYRHLETMVGAWRTRGVPVLTVAALLALVVAATAAAGLVRSRPPAGRWLLLGSVGVAALSVAAAVPIGQSGHASSVDLRVGPLGAAGIGLAAVMALASVAIAAPSGRALAGFLAGGLVVAGAAVGIRWLDLHAAEGTGAHWADGTYARPAEAGFAAMTLTVEDGRYRLGGRWAGTWEGSGWTVVLDDDPACPDSRGAYHAHGEGDADLRFVKVVDTCEEGARAEALEAGTWRREP
jgi:hypothetical protein